MELWMLAALAVTRVLLTLCGETRSVVTEEGSAWYARAFIIRLNEVFQNFIKTLKKNSWKKRFGIEVLRILYIKKRFKLKRKMENILRFDI